MLKKAEEALVAFCIISITAIMNVNVVMRYVFNSSWTPTEEVCLILVVLMTFIGSVNAARIGLHLFASLVFDIPAIPQKFKKSLAIVISVVCAALCLLLACLAIQFVGQNYASHRTTPSLGIPFYVFYCVLPVAFLMMAWHNIRAAALNLKMREGYALAPEKEEE